MKHYKETVRQVIDKCTCDICGEDTDIPDNGSALQSLSCTIQAATQFSYYGDVDCKDIDIDICYRCIGKVLQSIELKSEKMNEADKFLIEVQDFLNN